jgi:hypothetical protein
MCNRAAKQLSGPGKCPTLPTKPRALLLVQGRGQSLLVACGWYRRPPTPGTAMTTGVNWLGNLLLLSPRREVTVGAYGTWAQ